MRSSCYRKKPIQRLIAAEGYRWIALSLFATVVAWFFGEWPAAILPLVLTGFVISFFRNPNRKIQRDQNVILSPADGKILSVEKCREERYLGKECLRVSIFMSPFNCHINRAPVAGRVVATHYKTGTFEAAFKPKAMETNEHHAVHLADTSGRQWMVVQIAGSIARRIVSYVQPNDSLDMGERFGLIQFGSRTDLYCPPDTKILVSAGEKVRGGKTIIGRTSL